MISRASSAGSGSLRPSTSRQVRQRPIPLRLLIQSLTSPRINHFPRSHSPLTNTHHHCRSRPPLRPHSQPPSRNQSNAPQFKFKPSFYAVPPIPPPIPSPVPLPPASPQVSKQKQKGKSSNEVSLEGWKKRYREVSSDTVFEDSSVEREPSYVKAQEQREPYYPSGHRSWYNSESKAEDEGLIERNNAPEIEAEGERLESRSSSSSSSPSL